MRPLRYVEQRRPAAGTIAYYFCPPAPLNKAHAARNEARGTDPLKRSRARLLNNEIDDWRGEDAKSRLRIGSID